MIPLRLVKNLEYHPFMLDYIYEFQQAFIEAFPQSRVIPGRFITVKRQGLRVIRHLYRRLPERWRFSAKLYRRTEASFAVLCGGDFAYCLPSALTSERNYIYVFDAWPQAYEMFLNGVKFFSIDKIFFSALQSAELFNNALGEKRAIWIPEGIYSDAYYYLPYEQKIIDVVEFGRRYEKYHARVTPALAARPCSHYFARGMLNPLPQSKISICFPSSTTHPERSGYISTMTLRYLQSMVSKCLIVGELPYDMQYLFDYDPVIKADLDDPAGQLFDILDNYPDYIPLIEKNFQTVMHNHQWSNRMEMIRPHIEY